MKPAYLTFLLSTLLGAGLSCSTSDAENRGGEDKGDGGADSGGDDLLDSGGDDAPDSGADDSGSSDVPYDGCDSMDILFVIDNSLSMADEQRNLADNFPKFVDVLEAYRTPIDTPIDFRVGVTTTSVNRQYTRWLPTMNYSEPRETEGEDGVLQGQADCGMSDPWLEGPHWSVEATFPCMAKVGTDGSDVEMPFAAIEEALGPKSEPGQPNEGFYRADESSLLVVVIITDEDDCSVENGGTLGYDDPKDGNCSESKSTDIYDPYEMVDFLVATTGAVGRFVVVAIGRLVPGSCEPSFGEVEFAERINRFVEASGKFGVAADKCTGDLWPALEAGLEKMQVSCDSMPPV